VKMFDAGKTRMTVLPYGEKKTMTIIYYVKPFSADTGTLRTDRRIDGQTEFYINIARQCADAR